MNRRGFFATLFAAPIAAVVALKAKPVVHWRRITGISTTPRDGWKNYAAEVSFDPCAAELDGFHEWEHAILHEEAAILGCRCEICGADERSARGHIPIGASR